MLRLILFSFSLILTTVSFGQTQAINSIKKGDVNTLLGTFTDEVDISFNDQGDLISKVEAGKMLQTFLNNNKPVSYAVSHTGKAPDNKSFFSIGKLKTASKTFRVYIKYSMVSGAEVVKELRFNEE